MIYYQPNALCYDIDVQSGYTRFIIEDISCDYHYIYNIIEQISRLEDSFLFFEMSFEDDLYELLNAFPCLERQKIYNKGKSFLHGFITKKYPFLILYDFKKKSAFDFLSRWSHVVYTNQCLCIYNKTNEQDIINMLSDDKVNFEQRINLVEKFCHAVILNIPESDNDSMYDIICNNERSTSYYVNSN